jgi:hypothetical protein
MVYEGQNSNLVATNAHVLVGEIVSLALYAFIRMICIPSACNDYYFIVWVWGTQPEAATTACPPRTPRSGLLIPRLLEHHIAMPKSREHLLR